MGSTKAPVALFAYCRPAHVARTLDALARNPEASSTDLIAFVDGPRSPEQEPLVAQVREACTAARGFGSVTVHARPTNLGLATSVVQGVSAVLREHPSVIVLEDDLEVSPAFLAYMNDGLEQFASDDAVVSVHGYVYPLRRPVPEAFFIRGADCWGWATWRRGWQVYRDDARELLDELQARGLERAFDFDGAFPYTAMLRAQAGGAIDSWAIRWYASAFLANKLTLYPGRSLVRNIGQDGSGTHGDIAARADGPMPNVAPSLAGILAVEDLAGRAAFIDYFRREQRWHRKLAWQVRQWRRAVSQRGTRR